MNWLIILLVNDIPGCVSISAFTSLIPLPLGITSSAVGLKICAITGGIKKYKSIIKKKKKNDTILLRQTAHICHNKFLSVNNVLTEYNKIKDELKIPETSVEYII